MNFLCPAQSADGVSMLVGRGQIEVDAAQIPDAHGFELVNGFVYHGAQFLRCPLALELYLDALGKRFPCLRGFSGAAAHSL